MFSCLLKAPMRFFDINPSGILEIYFLHDVLNWSYVLFDLNGWNLRLIESWTSTGRILNRFSKDTGAVDETLAMAMLEALQIFSVTIGIMIQLLIVNWWTVFPMLVMGILYLQIRNIYLDTAQDVKRLEGNGKKHFIKRIYVL